MDTNRPLTDLQLELLLSSYVSSYDARRESPLCSGYHYGAAATLADALTAIYGHELGSLEEIDRTMRLVLEALKTDRVEGDNAGAQQVLAMMANRWAAQPAYRPPAGSDPLEIPEQTLPGIDTGAVN